MHEYITIRGKGEQKRKVIGVQGRFIARDMQRRRIDPKKQAHVWEV